jgi:hypothetical protein
MKHIFLSCCICGKTKRINGETVQEIIKAIDASGWVDGPEEDYCPECDKDREED